MLQLFGIIFVLICTVIGLCGVWYLLIVPFLFIILIAFTGISSNHKGVIKEVDEVDASDEVDSSDETLEQHVMFTEISDDHK